MSTPNNPRPTGNERWRRIRAPYFTEGPVTFNNYILSTSGQLHNNRGRELQSSPGDRPTRYLLRDPNQRLDAAGIPRRLYVVLAELVLYTFSDNAPPIILPIRHIDGDTRNNGLYNLEFDFQGDPQALNHVTWVRASHPNLIHDRSTYYVSPDGLFSAVHNSTSKRALSTISTYPRSPIRFVRVNHSVDITFYELMAYTFHNGFDHEQHHVFLRDQDPANCSLPNIRICWTLDQHRTALIESLEDDYPDRQWATIDNVHDTYTFNQYLITSEGEVFTLRGDRRLSAFRNHGGYHVLHLVPDPVDDLPSRATHILLHWAVWCSFNGRVEDGYVVDHRNNHRDDNRLRNLRTVSFSDNIRHAYTAIQAQQRESDYAEGRRDTPIIPAEDANTVWLPIGVIRGTRHEVLGHFNHYEVSNNGLVRRTIDQIPIPIWLNNGYQKVRLNLSRNQQERSNIPVIIIRVHRLVADAFVPGYGVNGRFHVDHIDANRQNNHHTNLQWLTNQENVARALGFDVRVTVVETGQSRTFNSLAAANRAGLVSFEIRSRHFPENGVFTRMGVWDDEQTMLQFELLMIVEDMD